MRPLGRLLKIVLGIDPELREIERKTVHLENTLKATINGDPDWMLQCRPKIDFDKIDCNDGGTYKREK